jgi:hypothetical protein
MANRLDRSVRAELFPETPDAYFYDVRARIERVPPNFGKQAFSADHFAGVQDEMVKQPELTVGEIADDVVETCLAPREVEDEASAAHGSRVIFGPGAS